VILQNVARVHRDIKWEELSLFSDYSTTIVSLLNLHSLYDRY